MPEEQEREREREGEKHRITVERFFYPRLTANLLRLQSVLVPYYVPSLVQPTALVSHSQFQLSMWHNLYAFGIIIGIYVYIYSWYI